MRQGLKICLAVIEQLSELERPTSDVTLRRLMKEHEDKLLEIEPIEVGSVRLTLNELPDILANEIYVGH